MKLSLITLMTIVSAFCWGMGLFQAPLRYRSGIIMATFFAAVLILFFVAMTRPVKNGRIELEQDDLFNAVEPAIKTIFFCVLMAIIGFLIVVAVLVVVIGGSLFF